MNRQDVLLRRAPAIVSYWQRDRLIFENYATGVRISADPLTFQILQFFDGWRSAEALAGDLPQFTSASVRAALAALERHSFLMRGNDRGVAARAAPPNWTGWDPAAGFFHLSTKDVPYSHDQSAAYDYLRRKTRRSPEPSPLKRYPRARLYRLPSVAKNGEFPQVLLARRTWRDFSPRSVRLTDLSTLLGLTWRVQGWLKPRGLGRLPLKTSPSGGARHPIEVYVLALRVKDLPRGLYHYAADQHCLERLQARASAAQVRRYLPAQPRFGSSAALMIMTAVFARTQWKYPFPRAYRVVLAEAGHLCQTFCLAATWLGLAPFCTMALADSRIEKDLKLDGITESVVYVAGVGSRPAAGVPSP